MVDPQEIWERLPYATILSEEGSREVLEDMARPPKDTPERRRTFAGARFMADMWRRQEAAERAGTNGHACEAKP